MSDQEPRSRYHVFFIIIPLIAFFFALLWLSFSDILTGDAAEFILAGGMVAPFVILALLAYAGEEHGWLRYVAVLWLFAILFCLWAFTLVFTIAPAAIIAMEEDELTQYLDSLPPGMILAAFAGPLCAVLFGLLGFSRWLRGRLARILPFDPDSFTHTIGLVTVLSLIAMPLVPLIVTGNAPLLDAGLQEVLGIGIEDPGSSVKFDTFTLIWTVIASFFLAGLWLKRDLKGTCERLGLVRPTIRQVALGILSGIVLVGVFWIVDDTLVALFTACGITITDETLVNKLFMVSFTPLAAVVASVSAGLGEELSIRGVVQPRFGIILSAMVFASLHAYQYAWDGVIGVFLAGICFGLLRQYTNTSTSAISHGVYDLVLFALIMAGITTI